MEASCCGRLTLLFTILVPLASRSDAQVRRPVMGFGEASRIELEYRRWRPSLVSSLEVGGDAVRGTPLSATEDLGLPDERAVDLRGFLRLGRRLKMRASRISVDYQGLSSLEEGASYSGIQFPEGASVETTLDLDYFKWGAELDILSSRAGYGFLAVVADYSRLEATPELTSPEEGKASRGPLRVRLLTLGLRCRIYLTPAVAVTGEASGMKRGGNAMTDLEGSITYNMHPRLAVAYGYRNHHTEWVEGDDRADFRLRGYYFSVIVRF